jgi:tetratricopeptide (TPR) repeat protein
MSNVAKLKKQAADLELKKQFDKALAIYVKLLDSFDQHAAELDVALFNRVGDLMVRQGNVADAVEYYEQAVDRYTDTGFFNNAIALCNKILRASPGRASVYYKLGKISAQKGFITDAKVNFLEYADRMQKAGKIDEAFRALKEFADLCPDQDDIRLMLADQLTKLDRKDEAIEQLQMLYERYDGEGRATEAMATADRMRSIDPAVEPRSADTSRKTSSSDLVFLDLDAPPSRGTPASPGRSGAAPAATRPVVAPSATAVRPPLASPPPKPPAPAPPPTPRAAESTATNHQTQELSIVPGQAESLDAPLSGITRIGDDVSDDLIVRNTPSASLLGLESTHLGGDDESGHVDGSSILGIEPTSFGALDDGVIDAPARDSESTESTESTKAADEPLVIDWDISPATEPEIGRAEETDNSGSDDGLTLIDLELPEPPRPSRSAARPGVAIPPVSSVDTSRTVPASAVGNFDLIELETELAAAEAPVEVDPEEPVEVAAEAPVPEPTAPDRPPRRNSVAVPASSVGRRATMVAERSVELLRAGVVAEPERWALRRELGEAMLEAGDRAGGIQELETAMTGAESAGDLDLASGLAEEIARLEPDRPQHHRKRVEYAFRMNDRGGLIEAYLDLADALLRGDETDKARTIYQRVVELAPDEVRAHTALETLTGSEPETPAAPSHAAQAKPGRVGTAVAASHGADFINLGDLLRDDTAKDTRMIVAEQEPTGDEEADFADMLRKFKQGIAENVDAEDYQSHYDLAIAYKEMGLLDEAISEFQKALASPTNRLPTYEALGQCFVDKGQFKLASSILTRALSERGTEDQLVGVLYLLGRAAEASNEPGDALGYYHRVLVVDIQFRDVVERITQLEQATR